MDDTDPGGYSVAYRRDEIAFPVIVTAMLSAVFFATAFVTGQAAWILLGVAGTAATYYNIPLLETGRPTIGANQYGIFVQGLGLVRWRAIERIDLAPTAERSMITQEMQIALRTPLDSALVADWRKRPLYRTLMRLPWSMTRNKIIRIGLEPFDRDPAEIHETLLRMWRFYRS
jgi:hypothetical protein